MVNENNRPLAVITGASSGIGASIARRFAKEGFRVALLARRINRLEELQKEIGSSASVFELDVKCKDKTLETMSHIEQTLGPIDILVNNAGCGFGLDPAYNCNLDDWEQCVEVNINGLLYCTRAVLPLMVKRDSGHVINIGSVAGTYPYPGANVYGATKAFVHQFSLNLRADLLGTQVRVSCIEPGLVDGTEFSEVRFKGDKQKATKVYENTNSLHPDDIAEVIYFCNKMPRHANINTIEIMPVNQASGPIAIYRK
jgi:3-hydroxy acid dehydrogenase / malonic semialdehyde reductase